MKRKLMVIDDEQMILDMLRDQFELEQYQVITAKNSEEAIQKLTGQPDIILLDINMPGTDGISLCQTIRNHVTCPILFGLGLSICNTLCQKQNGRLILSNLNGACVEMQIGAEKYETN